MCRKLGRSFVSMFARFAGAATVVVGWSWASSSPSATFTRFPFDSAAMAPTLGCPNGCLRSAPFIAANQPFSEFLTTGTARETLKFGPGGKNPLARLY